MKVKLLNFDDYLGRTDVKRPLWFAFDNSFLGRQEYFGKVTPDVLMMLVYVASETTKIKKNEFDMNPHHAMMCCMMNGERIMEALKVLDDLKLVGVTWEGAAQVAPMSLPCDDQPMGATGNTNRKEGKEEVVQGTRYVPCTPDGEPLEDKRYHQPKASPTPDQFIKEFEPVASILKGRGISVELQRRWLNSYSIEFMLQKIKDLSIWELTAGAKGKKKNWGRFYSGVFLKDWDRWSARLPGIGQAQQSQRKKTYWEQQQDELDRQKAQQGGAQ